MDRYAVYFLILIAAFLLFGAGEEGEDFMGCPPAIRHC